MQDHNGSLIIGGWTETNIGILKLYGDSDFSTAPPNAAPVNSVPESQTTYTDEPLAFTAFKGNAISISDADAGPNANTVKSVGRQWFSFSRRARVES